MANDELRGKDFIALRRLSDKENNTIAEVGQTCERVPAGRFGGTASDALRKLLNSGKIAPAPEPIKGRRAKAVAAESEAE